MTNVEVYLDIAGDQIDGARDYQEDAFLISYVDDEGGRPKSTALLAMADGVGGAAAGNIASQLVTNTFNRQFTSRFGDEPVPDILVDALTRGNDSLRKSIAETPGLDGMGCTVVTAAITRGKLWWVSVGDSHLYVVRNGALIKKNADHSYGAYLDLMEAHGTPVEPDPNLRRNMLMSALSGEDITMVDCPNEPFDLLPGDRVIVCSDGLDTLDADTIVAVSEASGTPKECVANLLQAVTDAAKPRQDNTTVIVCDVIAEEAAAVPEPVALPPEPEPEPEPVAMSPEPAPEPQPVPAHVIAAPVVDPVEQRRLDEIAEHRRARIRRGVMIAMVLGVVIALAWVADRFDAASQLTGLLARSTPDAEAPLADVTPDADEASAATDDEPPLVAPAPEQPPFRDRLRSGGDGPRMVALPAGSFMMGVRGSVDASETPQRRVDLAPFAIATHEITFAEYDRFARATGRRTPPSDGLQRATHPVFGISWHDAVAYTEWLSRETGHRYGLPSEAQWEYAASAGSTAPYWWGFQPPQGRAHCFNCTPGLPARLPTAVGSFEPNRFGLHDTVGNVAEWVQDCYHPNYRGAPVDGSVWEGGDCSVRVVRGGHYASPTPTTQKRDRFPPGRGYADIGFRVVREQ